MSPEQLSGEEVDGRSDLFSLGVILYTALTGYRPFQGNSAMTVSFKVVNRDPVPASILDTDLPPGLDYIIARAMAKDPAQRYQRGMEMVLDIQELREGREPWSKTKQPGSFAPPDAVQTASLRAKAWATGQRAVAAKPRSSTRSSSPLLGRDVVQRLLEKMRGGKSIAGALLLVGLLIFGLQMRGFIWREKFPNSGEPLSSSGEESVKKTTSVTTTSAEVSSAAPSTGIVKKKTPHVASVGAAVSSPVRLSRASSPVVPVVPPSVLDIEVEHKFAEAQLSIWVDDHLTYTHSLEGADKKHLVVFHKVQGHEFHAVQIPPGRHSLRVRVASGADSYDQSGTVEGEFASEKEKMLRINFGKGGEMQLSLQ
jgi:serine/threonine-protein kinase